MAVALWGCGAAVPPAARPGSLVARRPAPGQSAPACQDRACATATFDAEAGRFAIAVRVEPSALPAERARVEVRCGDEVHDLGAVSEPAELRCEVALESRVAPGESFRHPAGWHLAGRSFVPSLTVDGAAVDVPATLSLDVGEAPLYSSAGPGHRVLDAPSFARLAEESFEVGPIALTRRDVVGDTLWIGGTGRGDGELEVAADAIATAYRELVELLGDGPASSLLVVLHRPDGPAWEERAGATVVWALPATDDPELAIAAALEPLVGLFLRSAEPWLAEGVVSYLATRLGLEQLGFDRPALARQVVDRVSAGDAPPGLVAGFCLDRDLGESGGSLAATLRGARPELTTEGLLADLAAVSPAAAGHLAALLGTGEEPSLDPCLERAGLRIQTDELDAPSSDAWREALGVADWDASARVPALRVSEAGPDAPLADGDLLLAVAGQPVATPEDVAWALRDVGAGRPVRLEVRRRGRRAEVDWTAPDLSAAERAVRPVLRVVPIEATTP